MTETAASTSSSLSPGRWRRALRRLLGPLLLLALGLLLVLLAGIAWIAAHFNPQTQSRQLVEQVRARTGYLLTPAAPPRLTFTPRLGLAWGPLTLEAAPAETETEPGAPLRRVAAAQRLHLTLDGLALLRGETQVRRVEIEGLSLWPGPDRRYVLPALELNLSSVQATADASGSVPPSAAPTTPPGGADTAVAEANPPALPPLTQALDLQATLLNAAGQTLPLSLRGQFGVDSRPAQAHGGHPDPRPAMHLVLQGHFDQTTIALDVSRSTAALPLRFDLALGTLDLDRYRARPLAHAVVRTVALTPKLGAVDPALGLTVSDAGQPLLSAAGPGPDLDWARNLGLTTVDMDGTLRVASLKLMNVQLAHLRLQLRTREVQRQDSQGQERRRIDLNAVTASLYGGGVHGAVRLHLDGDPPAPPRASPQATYVAAKLDLRGVQLGPLLRNALGVDWLEGRGNVALDLRSSGLTPDTFRRQLSGTVGLQLREGAIGLNLAEVLRAGLGRIGKMAGPRPGAKDGSAAAPPRPADAAAGWRTPFDRLRASIQIDKGVARNQDLDLQSPSLRVGGAGTAWLAEDRLDYTLRVTVAPAGLQTAAPGSAPDLDALQGLTVPVQLRGPYQDLQWRIAYADITPTRQLRKRLRGWAEDSLDALRGLLPPGAPKTPGAAN